MEGFNFKGPQLLLLLLLHAQPLSAQCPSPYKIETGRCLFVKRMEVYTWCQANQQCQAIGGELINQYASLKLLDQMPSVNCVGCRLWYGVSDLADERNTQMSGWQRVNDNGLLPYNATIWHTGMPSSVGNQDCIASSAFTVKFIDNECTNLRGFVCEYVNKPPASGPSRQAVWSQTAFSRTKYNPSTDYCFADAEVTSLIECLAAAMTDGSSKHVLYNTKTMTCRILQFSDAQVDQWIENGASWVKFSI